MIDGQSLAEQPKHCDETCVRFRHCRKPKSCPVLARDKARKPLADFSKMVREEIEDWEVND